MLISNRGLNVLAFILLFLFMPETKQCTLEDLDHTCKQRDWQICVIENSTNSYLVETPAPDFARQQVEKTFPGIVKRYVQYRHREDEF